MRSLPSLLYTLVLGGLACACLAACAPIVRAPFIGQQTPYFRPPPPALSPSAAAAASATGQPHGGAEAATQPAAQDACKDSLTFVKDLTIPDGTVVAPESTMDKRWEVENSGNCNWNKDYRIRMVGGPEMGTQKEQALYPARSGSRATIRILFKAPVEPGSYRSAWQAFNAQGEPFGDLFFIDIVVQGN